MKRASVAGIALVQVLIITTVLSLLGLYISQAVREQVKSAHTVQQAFLLRAKLENAEARLLQSLLSYKFYPNAQSDNDLVRRWNFYGKEFAIDEQTHVTLTDMAGLISLNITDKTLLANLLYRAEIPEQQRREFVDALSDWKDKDDLSLLNGAESAFYRQQGQGIQPRNGYLQSIEEARLLRGGQALDVEFLRRYCSIEMVRGFNPLNAPEQLLKAFINDDKASELVLQAREQGTLTPLVFFQLTGIDGDEYITFATDSKIRVQLRVEQNGSQLIKQFLVDVEPRSLIAPLTFSDITWN